MYFVCVCVLSCIYVIQLGLAAVFLTKADCAEDNEDIQSNATCSNSYQPIISCWNPLLVPSHPPFLSPVYRLVKTTASKPLFSETFVGHTK